MAAAFKCDRCGKLYEYRLLNGMTCCGVNLTSARDVIELLPTLSPSKKLNFCPDCITGFINFMEVGKNETT